jgi:hypothetical protein
MMRKSRPVCRRLGRLLLFLSLCAAWVVDLKPDDGPSLVIAGARIADGSGAPIREGNVRVVRNRITRIGAFRPKKGEEVVQGGGLVLARAA